MATYSWGNRQGLAEKFLICHADKCAFFAEMIRVVF